MHSGSGFTATPSLHHGTRERDFSRIRSSIHARTQACTAKQTAIKIPTAKNKGKTDTFTSQQLNIKEQKWNHNLKSPIFKRIEQKASQNASSLVLDTTKSKLRKREGGETSLIYCNLYISCCQCGPNVVVLFLHG
jgi:hypothetical protein